MTEDHAPIKVVPTWQKVAFAAIAVVAFFLLVYIANLSRSGFATLDSQKTSAERTDCRAEINGWYAILDRRANTLGRSLAQQRAAAELQGIDGVSPSEEQITVYDLTQHSLKVANDAVDALPNVQTAAEQGWTPDANALATVPDLPKHFAPCPKV